MAFEVQRFTEHDGWLNDWDFNFENGEYKPTYFETKEAAEVILEYFLRGCNDEQKKNFRIVEVQGGVTGQ